jgi:hypothetical protein
MNRILKRLPFLAVILSGACIDESATMPEPAGLPMPVFNVAITQCERALTLADGNLLISRVYLALGGANATTAQTQWQIINSTSSTATQKRNAAWVLADDVLSVKQAGSYPSSTDMTRLINVSFCLGGVSGVGFPGGDGWVVQPGENAAQLPLINSGAYAGFVLPANTVTTTTGPRLFAISPSIATLNTPLDVYGTAQEFSSYPQASFPNGVYVGLCGGVSPIANVSPEQLSLGHNLGNGTFEVLPPSPTSVSWATLLNCLPGISIATSSTGCETYYAGTTPSSWSDRLWAVLLPRKAQAATITGGCAGVGGTLSTLSPVRPVDPRLEVVAPAGLGTSAAAGYPVWASPSVIVQTPTRKTPVAGVRVTFSLTSGTGGLLPTGVVSTDATGKATKTFWTLSTAANPASTLRMRPDTATGTPAVKGVIFTPAFVDLTGTATSAAPAVTRVAFNRLPTATIARAGSTDSVRVTVYKGSTTADVATNYNGPVTFTSTTGAIGGQTTVQAVNGVAKATLAFLKVGSRQTLTATAAHGTRTYTASATFTVTAADTASARIVRVGTTALSAATGASLSGTGAPKVRVEDQYGNLVTNRSVYFRAGNNSSAVAPTTAVSTGTATGGIGPTAWPIQFGLNTLVASMDATLSTNNPNRWIEIPATGTATATAGDVYKACEPGGSVPTYLNVATYAPRLGNLSQTDQLQKITNVKLFLNSSGTPGRVGVRLTIKAYNGTTLTSSAVAPDVQVAFRGTASEQKEVNFIFATPFDLAGDQTVIFQATSLATGRTVNYVASVPDRTSCDFNSVAHATPTGTAFAPTAAIRVIAKQY